MINKKKLAKILIIISLIVIIIFAFFQIRKTLARYETTANTERDVNVAFWVVDNTYQTQRLLIQDIMPRDDAYEYTFSVSNFIGDDIAEVDMEYDIAITTTTNLPLVYELQKKQADDTWANCTIAVNSETGNIGRLYQDADSTWYREIKFGTTEIPYPMIIDTIQYDADSEEYHNTKITDTYKLKVTFPKTYSANLSYADLIEEIKIDLSARQIIEEQGS